MRRFMVAMICVGSVLVFTPVHAATKWGCIAANEESDAGGRSYGESWGQPSHAAAFNAALHSCEQLSLNTSIAEGGYGVCGVVDCEANIDSCEKAHAMGLRFGGQPAPCSSK